MKKKILSFILSASILLTMADFEILAGGLEAEVKGVTPTASAAVSGSSIRSKTSELLVDGGLNGTDYDYKDNTLTIKTSTPITISGTTATDHIEVEKSVTANITLSNLTITCPDNHPFGMEGALVNLILKGTNTLNAPKSKAALYCPAGSSLTISGAGTLNANGSNQGGGAAIGGESAQGNFWDDSGICGEITINSGTINAICDTRNATAYTAAIGGYSGGPITINGGSITAMAGGLSVGIGSLGDTFNGIYINGGTVTAETKYGTPFNDIGTSTSWGPAIGIRGARRYKTNIQTPDTTYPKIIITGGIVKAKSNWGCAGIGGGRDGSGGIITITGNADVTAIAGEKAAGIGAGYVQNGNGITGDGGIITIEGNAKVNAAGGINGAGIGGGCPRQADTGRYTNQDGWSGTITIAGNADVTATGGEAAPGIGSGASELSGVAFSKGSKTEKIILTGNAKINAIGGKRSICPIGPGKLPDNSANPSPAERFEQYICTIPGIITPVPAKNSLIINADGNYIVTGNVTLERDFTIPDGKKLIISDQAVLNIPDGILLTPKSNIELVGSGKLNEGSSIVSTYLLTVQNGTGGGRFIANTAHPITAVVPVSKKFTEWQLASGTGIITDKTKADTTFIMGNGPAAVTAIFKEIDEIAPAVDTVKVSPAEVQVQKGQTQQFNADVTGSNNVAQTVTWKVAGGSQSSTSINTNGLLTVDVNETAKMLTITAISTIDTSKMGTAAVTITNTPVIKHILTVNGGTGSGSYEKGNKINIAAVIPAGKKFVRWQLNGDGTISNSADAQTSFIMGSNDAEITAIFKDTDNDNSGGSDSNGSSSGSSDNGSSNDSNVSGCSNESTDNTEKNMLDKTGIGVILPTESNHKINLSEEVIKKAIQNAKKDALSKSTSNLGVDVSLAAKSKAITISLTNPALKQLVGNNAGLSLTAGTYSALIDVNALKSLENNLKSEFVITVSTADISKNKNAKKLIMNHPVMKYAISYKDKKGKTVTYDKTLGTGKITYFIPYQLKKTENTANMFAVSVNKSGKTSLLNQSVYDTNRKGILFTTNYFSTFGIGYKAPVKIYSDIKNHWAKDSIEYVVSRSLLPENGSKNFSPNASITKADLVTALGRLSNININNYKKNQFTDVKSNAVYSPYAQWAVKKGIVPNISAKQFGSNNTLTRHEFAVIITDYCDKMEYKLPVNRNKINFTDLKSISPAADTAKIIKMQQAGIIAGKSNGYYKPDAAVTKAEFCMALQRLTLVIINKNTLEGWDKNDSGQFMYYKDGIALTDWQTIEKRKYYFDSYGNALTSEWKTDTNGNQFYLAANGSALTGWRQINKKWYYFDNNGKLAKNTVIDGYKVNENGERTEL